MSKPQNKKRIGYLIFTSAPSSMVRAQNFSIGFDDSGYEASFIHLYSVSIDRVVSSLGLSKIPGLNIMCALLQTAVTRLKRYLFLKTLNNFDAFVVVKYSPPAFFRDLRRRTKAQILYDFDDALWVESFFMGPKVFHELILLADFVSCDNHYLADYVKKLNTNVFVVNGPSQCELFDSREPLTRTDDGLVRIGWLGSPSTVFYLYRILDELEAIGEKYKNVELIIAGSGSDKSRLPPFEKMKVRCVPSYDQPAMVDIVHGFDIGLYPLYNNELSLGRGCLKATIYMSGGVPVVASRIGDNVRLIENGVSGFLASNSQDWVNALSKLIEDKNLRSTVGACGRQIAHDYTVRKCFKQLEDNFLSKI